jgi:hypothetical protein
MMPMPIADLIEYLAILINPDTLLEKFHLNLHKPQAHHLRRKRQRPRSLEIPIAGPRRCEQIIFVKLFCGLQRDSLRFIIGMMSMLFNAETRRKFFRQVHHAHRLTELTPFFCNACTRITVEPIDHPPEAPSRSKSPPRRANRNQDRRSSEPLLRNASRACSACETARVGQELNRINHADGVDHV